ncbi:hypothetical protein OKHIL_76080 [Mycolicibacterium mageritense]
MDDLRKLEMAEIPHPALSGCCARLTLGALIGVMTPMFIAACGVVVASSSVVLTRAVAILVAVLHPEPVRRRDARAVLSVLRS